ncbi:MAG: Gfo/Idh/MocA family oxidoreductase, partial [Thermoproteales archaeon]|nr:Gfo/Idh/MocA family oxidoreductase [Thermoproteales archaeon]
MELVAMCDVNEPRAREIASRYGVRRYYTDYREMLEREELDLVSVATPDFLHYEPTITAIDAGVNVLVEKPLATKLEEAEEMVRRARRRGVKLYVNFSNRFNPPFAALKDSVEKGELGDLLYSYVRLSDTIYVPTKMLSWASQTNVVFFLMSHTFDLVRWIYGSEARSVRAYAEFRVLKRLGINAPDYVIAIIEFGNEARAVLESSWILPESMPSIVDFQAEFIGTRGVAYIDTTRQMISIASEAFYYPRITGATVA